MALSVTVFLFLDECVVPKYRNRTGEANLDILQCSHAFVYISLCEFMMSSRKKSTYGTVEIYINVFTNVFNLCSS